MQGSDIFRNRHCTYQKQSLTKCNVVQCQKSTCLQQISQIVYIHLSGVLRIGKWYVTWIRLSFVHSLFLWFPILCSIGKWKKTDNGRLYNLDTQIWGLACKLEVLYYICARNSSRHHKNEHLCVFQTKWCWDRKRWAEIKLVYLQILVYYTRTNMQDSRHLLLHVTHNTAWHCPPCCSTPISSRKMPINTLMMSFSPGTTVSHRLN